VNYQLSPERIKTIKILLRVLAVFLSGVVVAVFGFIAGSMVLAIFGLNSATDKAMEPAAPEVYPSRFDRSDRHSSAPVSQANR
jgi:hypothetical protein